MIYSMGALVAAVALQGDGKPFVLWFSERLRKGPTAPLAFFSELDCAIVSTRGRTENFALKN